MLSCVLVLCGVGVQGPILDGGPVPVILGTHLDAGVDAVHQPVEEAAVDVLGQCVPAVVALGRGVRGSCWLLGGCRPSAHGQGMVPLTWGTLRVVSTVSSRAFTVREHSARSSLPGSSPISSQISCSSVQGGSGARAERGGGVRASPTNPPQARPHPCTYPAVQRCCRPPSRWPGSCCSAARCPA